MPEGHVTHRAVRDHSPLLVGLPVSVSSPQGRFADEARMIDGQVLQRLEAYGKHMFAHWANGFVVEVHLGLFGRFRVHRGEVPPDPVGQVRMRLVSARGTIDLAGPNVCRLGSVADRDAVVARLGPDPLRRDARPEVAIERMGRSAQPIGAVLLDQRVIAGVGNVFRAEALFVHGIHPALPARDCTAEQRAALWSTLATMLRNGVRDRRIVTIDRTRFPVPRGSARRGDTTYVYHRTECLICAGEVARLTLGGRDCWYCPTCQPG